MDDLRYPIGKFVRPNALTDAERRAAIDDIAAAPKLLRDAVRGLDDAQLDTPYRPDGWSVRQLVHHVADSHMNAYVRFKLALTEDTPPAKAYDENAWANTPEVRTMPAEPSLRLLDALHDRWVRLLETVPPGDFDRQLQHSQSGMMNLHQLLALYAWHGKHHVAHVTKLRERNGW